MMFSREIDSIDSDEKDSKFLVELGWKLLRNVSLGTGSKWANHTRAGRVEPEQCCVIDLPRGSSQHGLCVEVRGEKKDVDRYMCIFILFFPLVFPREEGRIDHNGIPHQCDIEFQSGRKQQTFGMAHRKQIFLVGACHSRLPVHQKQKMQKMQKMQFRHQPQRGGLEKILKIDVQSVEGRGSWRSSSAGRGRDQTLLDKALDRPPQETLAQLGATGSLSWG